MRMDPGPGERAGGGSGSRRERRERRRGRRKGEERRVVLRLLFLGDGDEGALASSPISRKCHVGSKSASAVLYKQLNINTIVINSLPVFIKTLTSAAQCFACPTFASGRYNADGKPHG